MCAQAVLPRRSWLRRLFNDRFGEAVFAVLANIILVILGLTPDAIYTPYFDYYHGQSPGALDGLFELWRALKPCVALPAILLACVLPIAIYVQTS